MSSTFIRGDLVLSFKRFGQGICVAFCSLGYVVSVRAAPAAPAPTIAWNQIGYLPGAVKHAVVPAGKSDSFRLLKASDGREILAGTLQPEKHWTAADERSRIADFSSVTEVGEYRLEVKGLATVNVTIGHAINRPLLQGAIKAFYYNRAGIPIEAQYAGKFARPAAHPDTKVYIHKAAASDLRPEGTQLSSPKGWYDAGDYNKYIVNSGISTYTLLRSLEDHAEFYRQLNLNIPESTNKLPDLLDEILWNLDWMETMQDPNDGGVYHKLTDLKFSDFTMPHTQNFRRYLMPKSTGAALNFAAVFALASRVVAPYESELPGASARYRKIALQAFTWAQAHPSVRYEQPSDVKTGMYAYKNEDFKDEWLWARSEMFALTSEPHYIAGITVSKIASEPEWSQVDALGIITLARAPATPAPLKASARQVIVDYAEQVLHEQKASGYGVALVDKDFRWGSNAIALNKALMLLSANQLAPNPAYKNAAGAILDYILGRNPTGYSFVTGFGVKSVKHPHHRISESDGVLEPVPGWLAGGPQPGWQDKCVYPSKLPAKSYLDDNCSYSTNEIAINWNAPLVYVAAEFQ